MIDHSVRHWGWGWCVVVGVMVGGVTLLCGCERGGSGAKPQAAEEGGEVRIVSLSPAFTAVLAELGMSDAIVGVAEHDAAAPDRPGPPGGVPVVGSFLSVDYERLATLRPTHLLTVRTRSSPTERTLAFAAEHEIALSVIDYPETVAQTLDSIQAVASAVGKEEPGYWLREGVEGNLDALRRETQDLPRPRVLMLLSKVRLQAVGPGSVLDELLTIAGGENVVPPGGGSAPVYDREAVLAMDPEVILLLLPGAPATAAPDLHPGLQGLDVPAVREGRVYVMGEWWVLLPSVYIADVATQMMYLLHPQLKPEE